MNEEPDPAMALENVVTAVAAAAARHNVTGADVQEHINRFMAMPWWYRSGVQTGQLCSALLELSELHRPDCAQVACRMCEGLGEALAVLLAGLRCGLAEDLRRRLG